MSRRLGALPLVLLALSNPARGQVLRFSTRTTGGIAATGNALGLSKATNINGPGTNDSIGTFISLDAASKDALPLSAANPWPTGTTADWTKDGSSAVLDLPSDARVLYAELVWGGSTNYGGEDVRASLDTAVTLGYGNATTSATPDAAS